MSLHFHGTEITWHFTECGAQSFALTNLVIKEDLLNGLFDESQGQVFRERRASIQLRVGPASEVIKFVEERATYAEISYIPHEKPQRTVLWTVASETYITSFLEYDHFMKIAEAAKVFSNSTKAMFGGLVEGLPWFGTPPRSDGLAEEILIGKRPITYLAPPNLSFHYNQQDRL